MGTYKTMTTNGRACWSTWGTITTNLERTHLQMQEEVSVPCMDEDCGNRAGAGAHVVGGLLHVHLGNLARLVLRVRPGQADTHASDALTSLITRISAMSPHGWVRVMLMANWGGGGVLTKHPLYKATRKQAPGPSWCRPLSRGAEGRRVWPAMTRSATCPSVARSSYSSLPHPPPAKTLPTLES